MLASIFMDLLYIVGIVFLGSIFVIVFMNTINEIKISRTKKNILKEFANKVAKQFEEELYNTLKDKEK